MPERHERLLRGLAGAALPGSRPVAPAAPPAPPAVADVTTVADVHDHVKLGTVNHPGTPAELRAGANLTADAHSSTHDDGTGSTDAVTKAHVHVHVTAGSDPQADDTHAVTDDTHAIADDVPTAAVGRVGQLRL